MNAIEPVGAKEPSIFCYIDEIPSFVEQDLVTAYASLHSSLPYFAIFRSIERVSCYIARHGERPGTVLLFRLDDRQIHVLNEMIEIDGAALAQFARTIFTRFHRVDVISFKAVKTRVDGLGFPVQQHASKNTYVVDLPPTPEAYTASLGQSTRAGIRQQHNRFLRAFPSYCSRVFHAGEADEQLIRQIIRLSEQRIQAQGAQVRHDVDRIIRLARVYGFVHVLLVDDRLCAGSINYRVGTSYFGEVTAYDPHYEQYGIGKLCVHQTICESILDGGKKFYLGGGVFDFKQRMLGRQLSMDEIHIYRSYTALLLNLPNAAAAAVNAGLNRSKALFHRQKKKTWARAVFRSFYFFRDKLK